jgi:hypothetical protein
MREVLRLYNEAGCFCGDEAKDWIATNGAKLLNSSSFMLRCFELGEAAHATAVTTVRCSSFRNRISPAQRKKSKKAQLEQLFYKGCSLFLSCSYHLPDPKSLWD